MKLEDYSKYYIQGSDHYLVPKDIFVELFNEMINWKQENEQLKARLELFENGVYFSRENDRLEEENEQLKKQLEEKEKKYIPGEYAKEEYIKEFDKNILLKKQQQEFIKWLEDEINRITILDETKVSQCSIPIIRCMKSDYKQILQKYKTIIGGNKDE